MKTLSFVALLLFVGCGSPYTGQKKKKPKFTVAQAAAIIIDARCMSYTSLPDPVKALTYDEFAAKPIASESEQIERENGYYLKMTVNNRLLARVSTNGGAYTAVPDSSDVMGLYGRDRNRPYLYNAARAFLEPSTRRREGYALITVIRKRDVDTTYWGPFGGMPVRLVLECADLDSASYPNINVWQ